MPKEYAEWIESSGDSDDTEEFEELARVMRQR